MSETPDHASFVDSWLARAEPEPHRVVLLLDAALHALWARTELALGELTLHAIFDRVLHTTAERFPPFGSIVMSEDGPSCEGLRSVAATMPRSELMAGVRFLLVEFLTTEEEYQQAQRNIRAMSQKLGVKIL